MLAASLSVVPSLNDTAEELDLDGLNVKVEITLNK